MPTRCLKVTTKSSPNGQGSKTWDRYEMRVYKRVLDINAPADTVRKIVRALLC
jgi:small subunit ribosomal protein S20e